MWYCSDWPWNIEGGSYVNAPLAGLFEQFHYCPDWGTGSWTAEAPVMIGSDGEGEWLNNPPIDIQNTYCNIHEIELDASRNGPPPNETLRTEVLSSAEWLFVCEEDFRVYSDPDEFTEHTATHPAPVTTNEPDDTDAPDAPNTLAITQEPQLQEFIDHNVTERDLLMPNRPNPRELIEWCETRVAELANRNREFNFFMARPTATNQYERYTLFDESPATIMGFRNPENGNFRREDGWLLFTWPIRTAPSLHSTWRADLAAPAEPA